MKIKFNKIFKLSLMLPFAALTIATPIVLSSCSTLGKIEQSHNEEIPQLPGTPPLPDPTPSDPTPETNNWIDLENLKTFENATKVKDDTFNHMVSEYVQEITSSNTNLNGKKLVHNNFYSNLTSQTGQIFKFLQIGLNDPSFTILKVAPFWSNIDEINKQLKVNITLTKDGATFHKELILSPWIINGIELDNLRTNIEKMKDTHKDIYDSFIGQGDRSIFSFIDRINNKNDQFGGIVGYQMIILDKTNKTTKPEICSIPMLINGKYKFVKVSNK